jgi:hypothetical protein
VDKKELLRLVLPLILIPLTLFAVSMFGHEAGNLIIGAAFLVGVSKFAQGNERRFMVILAIFAMLFEGLNVFSGAYKYLDTPSVPTWVGLGWSIVGIYLIKNLPLLKKVDDKISYLAACALYLGVFALQGFPLEFLIPAVFGVLGIYVLTVSSAMPASFFLGSSLLGMIIEIFGTSLGIWQYFDPAGFAIPVPLLNLGLAYSSVIVFALWISRLD